jgi:hypothetical protein
VQALEAPVADEYEPTAQEMQNVEAVAPGVVKYLPATQLVQLVDPVSDAYVPAEQLVQLDEPVSGW